MKRLLALLVILINSYSANAQFSPKLFGGLKGFYNKGYESNTYGGFDAGIEVLRFKFLAPEIGIGYFAGRPNELEFLDLALQPAEGRARYDGRFNLFNFTIAPKLIFGDDEAALVIIPEYNLGKMNTSERYFKRLGNSYEFREEVNSSNNISFWNFSAGVEGNFFNLDRVQFSFLLTYTTLNSEKAFKDLQFSTSADNYRGGSSDGIGVGFRVYYDLFSAL